MNSKVILLLFSGLLACSPAETAEPDPNAQIPINPAPTTPGGATLGAGQPGVVGLTGINAWDNLSANRKSPRKKLEQPICPRVSGWRPGRWLPE